MTPSSESPFVEQLEQLARPVPNYAATLTTQAENDADDDNVSFLRSRIVDLDSLPRRRPQFLSSEDFDRINTDAQRRIRRAIAGLRRYNPEQRRELGNINDATYGNRVPHQQSLYDWAPVSSDDENEGPGVSHPARPVGNGDQEEEDNNRRQHHEAPVSGPSRHGGVHLPSVHEARRSSDAAGVTSIPQPASQLRTRALLQSVRRHNRLPPRSGHQLQNYILDRERTGQDGEERERPSSSRPPRHPLGFRPVTPHVTLYELQQQEQELHNEREQNRELRARVEAYRLRYLENPSGNPPAVSRWLESAIKYLERVRFSRSYEESLTSAAVSGFVRGEFFSNDHEDFILDTASIDPPPESSWLRVGGVFSGSQHASHGPQSLYRMSDRLRDASHPPTMPSSTQDETRLPPLSNPRHPSIWNPASNSATTTTTASATSPGRTGPTPFSDERWPVKVTLHSVDYASMTLTGTMEAFNVPDKSSPTHESSITTFLEGEIIDFNTHTLETTSFAADVGVDGTYWRKLEPFRHLSDDEMVRCLVSKRWLSEVLGRKWILMRWKGQSVSFFLPPLCLCICWKDAPVNPDGGLTSSLSRIADTGFFLKCRKVLRHPLVAPLRPHHLRILLRLAPARRRPRRRPLLRPVQLAVSAPPPRAGEARLSRLRVSMMMMTMTIVLPFTSDWSCLFIGERIGTGENGWGGRFKTREWRKG